MSSSIQVLVTKPFARWRHKSQITNTDILGAAQEMLEGLIDASLGGHLVKKRALDQQAIAVAINAGQLFQLQGDE